MKTLSTEILHFTKKILHSEMSVKSGNIHTIPMQSSEYLELRGFNDSVVIIPYSTIPGFLIGNHDHDSSKSLSHAFSATPQVANLLEPLERPLFPLIYIECV